MRRGSGLEALSRLKGYESDQCNYSEARIIAHDNSEQILVILMFHVADPFYYFRRRLISISSPAVQDQ